MTNTQKWVLIFIAAFAILFLLTRITRDDKNELPGDYSFYNDEQTENNESSSQASEAMSVINRVGCVTCHGQDLKGTNMAPGLYNIAEYWDRNGLINYLRNPESYSGNERFEEYKEQYNMIMPAYGNVDVKDLGTIADYLLTLED